MKATTMKKGAAIAVMGLVIGAGSIFAYGNNGNRGNCQNLGQRESFESCDTLNFGTMHHNSGSSFRNSSIGRHDKAMGREATIDALGTVSKVSDDTIYLKNADGKTIKVSVNPRTIICATPTQEELDIIKDVKESYRDKFIALKTEYAGIDKSDTAKITEYREKANALNQEIQEKMDEHRTDRTLEVTNVAIGDWIEVVAFDTDTQTLEAARIMVTKN